MRVFLLICAAVFAPGAHAQCGPVPAGALDWSDGATWNGGGPSWTHPVLGSGVAPPPPGACVTIPASAQVMLDQDAVLAGLLIEGDLEFSCQDLELTSDWIDVAPSGRMIVGTSSQPFTNQAEITLADDYPARCAPPGDNPGEGQPRELRVFGGELYMHGAPRSHPWTELTATALDGDTEITVDGEVDWQPGEHVVIASTDFDPRLFEQREILANNTVAGSGEGTLTFASALGYDHFSGTDGPSGGPVVEMRAQVALLDRNIVVHGTGSDPYTDPGAQMRFMTDTGMTPGGNPPTIRLKWIEVRQSGTYNTMGEYPVHFHMAGDVGSTGSYVKFSSLHHNFFRALTIHDTDNLLVTGNVSHDTHGHAFYLENGTETGNSLRYNLGLTTDVIPTAPIVPSDAEAATFYVRHPDNVIEYNVSAGSFRHGFYYEVAGAQQDCQCYLPPPTSFLGNESHSNEGKGFYLDDQYTLVAGPPQPGDPVAHFDDFTAWMNQENGVWLRLRGQGVLSGFRMADNRSAFYLASGGWQSPDDSRIVVTDTLIIGESVNHGWLDPADQAQVDAGRSLPPTHASFTGPATIVGVDLYDGWIGVEDTTFMNFERLLLDGDWREAAAFSQVQKFSPWAVDPRNETWAVTFDNANRVYFRPPALGEMGAANAVLYDSDGSVTADLGGAYVIPDVPFLHPSDQALHPAPDLDPVTGESWNAHIVDGQPDLVYGQLQFINMEHATCKVPAFDVDAPGNRGTMTVSPALSDRDHYGFNVITTDTAYGATLDYTVSSLGAGCWPDQWKIKFRLTRPGETIVLHVPRSVAPANLQVDGNWEPCPGPMCAYSGGVVSLLLTTGGMGTGLLDGEEMVVNLGP